MESIKIDKLVKLVIVVSGGITSYLFGGWSAMMQALTFFVVVDYVTGILASGVEGKLSSQVGYKSIPKKLCIFLVVAVAFQIDKLMGNGSVLRDAVGFFYCGNEAISILENTGRMGLPVPETLIKAIAVLKGKSGVK